MNANSSPTAPTIDQWLIAGTAKLLESRVPSARLDCLILLEHATAKDRTWLLAHLDQPLSTRQTRLLADLLARRSRREPVAYLIGSKEFYGRAFVVNHDVLIPRPETEIGIELLKKHTRSKETILDVGTGTGCIAISAALELPDQQVAACDISPAALAVARRNKTLHHPPLQLFQSDLLSQADHYDCIVANLPYVDKTWHRSTETNFEPSLALFAENNGLALIKRLIDQAPAHLNPAGRLFLEADPAQHQQIIAYANQHHLHHLETQAYWLAFTAQTAALH